MSWGCLFKLVEFDQFRIAEVVKGSKSTPFKPLEFDGFKIKGVNKVGRTAKDLSGKRFGRLVAIKDSGERTNDGSVIWECSCDCGSCKKIPSKYLSYGGVKSCGCLAKDKDENYKKGYIDKTNIFQIASSKPSKNSKSGVKGVSFDEHNKKWVAYLWFRGEKTFRETFDDKQDAINARKEAEEIYFKPILEKYGKQQ